MSAMHRYQQDPPSNVDPGLDTCPGENTMDDQSVESDCSLDVGQEEACSREVLQKSTALFLLGLKEKHKLTQAAVQSVVEGVTSLL